jgi:hypothetical protein
MASNVITEPLNSPFAKLLDNVQAKAKELAHPKPQMLASIFDWNEGMHLPCSIPSVTDDQDYQ